MNIIRHQLTRIVVFAAGVIAYPTLAFAILPGDQLGTTDAEIRSALEAEGFIIRSYDRDSDEIEIDVVKNGIRMEIELSPAGRVLEIKLD